MAVLHTDAMTGPISDQGVSFYLDGKLIGVGEGSPSIEWSMNSPTSANTLYTNTIAPSATAGASTWGVAGMQQSLSTDGAQESPQTASVLNDGFIQQGAVTTTAELPGNFYLPPQLGISNSDYGALLGQGTVLPWLGGNYLYNPVGLSPTPKSEPKVLPIDLLDQVLQALDGALSELTDQWSHFDVVDYKEEDHSWEVKVLFEDGSCVIAAGTEATLARLGQERPVKAGSQAEKCFSQVLRRRLDKSRKGKREQLQAEVNRDPLDYDRE